MFIELCIKICMVMFVVICVLHRLSNKPADDIGVKALNIDIGQFICIGILFRIFAVVTQTLLLGLFVKILKFEKTNDISAIIFCLTSLVLTLVTIKLFCVFHGKIIYGTRPFINIVKSAIYNLGLIFPILFVVNFIWITLLQIVHSFGIHVDLSPQNNVQVFTNPDSTFAIITHIIIAVAIAPILEEIIFRGFIYRTLKGYGNKLSALGFTSLIFALMHWNLSAFAGLFVLGICLIQVYERNSDIREPMLIHALFNATTIVGLLWDAHATII
ncbi:MAG: CPBP family intramembrane metalloprotease [Puniceicoccales bacterium]|jgi:membrane protease YdiL (CAAX protease family)|nr:CPBP family intramembrane metalloprotease [Puniceicoccales bacterium]